MKSVLLSLSFILTILFTMASCQTQGSRSFNNHDDVRNEIIFKNEANLEKEVARIIQTASRTQAVQFVGYNMN